jgi:hypothetical protein
MDLTLCVECGILTVDTFATPGPTGGELRVTCRLCHLVFCLRSAWLESAKQGVATDAEEKVCAQLEELIGYLRTALREHQVDANVTVG